MVDALGRAKVFRRISLIFTLALTWEVYQFVMAGIEAKLITHEWMVAAILGSVSTLQAAVFKFYADSPP
ncbi:MAG: hypothetical protein ABW066_06745 [Sedimenticola sp.]